MKEDGEISLEQRANANYKQQLKDYELPEMDDELIEFMEKRKASFPDSNIE